MWHTVGMTSLRSRARSAQQERVAHRASNSHHHFGDCCEPEKTGLVERVVSSGPIAHLVFGESLCSGGGMSIPIDAGDAVVNARLFWTV